MLKVSLCKHTRCQQRQKMRKEIATVWVIYVFFIDGSYLDKK